MRQHLNVSNSHDHATHYEIENKIFDFSNLTFLVFEKFKVSLKKWNHGKKFDVIVTDPPWTLATEKSTRGVALNYDQITDVRLMNAVPFYDLINDDGGAIFMWVINAKLKWSLDFLREKGFK